MSEWWRHDKGDGRGFKPLKVDGKIAIDPACCCTCPACSCINEVWARIIQGDCQGDRALQMVEIQNEPTYRVYYVEFPEPNSDDTDLQVWFACCCDETPHLGAITNHCIGDPDHWDPPANPCPFGLDEQLIDQPANPCGGDDYLGKIPVLEDDNDCDPLCAEEPFEVLFYRSNPLAMAAASAGAMHIGHQARPRLSNGAHDAIRRPLEVPAQAKRVRMKCEGAHCDATEIIRTPAPDGVAYACPACGRTWTKRKQRKGKRKR